MVTYSYINKRMFVLQGAEFLKLNNKERFAMAFRAGKCLLRIRLIKAEMSQSELGRRVNLSPQMISHYVNDRKIMSLEVAKSIAAVLNCNVEDLYEWEHRNRKE